MKTVLALLGILLVFATACTPDNGTAIGNADDVAKTGTIPGDTTERTDVMVKDPDVTATDGAMEKTDEMEEDNAMMKQPVFTGTVLAGTTTKYIEFNEEDYNAARNANKVILLNFYAEWCPVCVREEAEAFAAFDETANDNIVGFRVHYKDSKLTDTQEALARTYGVSYQHTKVIIKDGERVLKAPDSWDKQRYLTELGKY